MKKIIILFAVFQLLLSCSSDDNDNKDKSGGNIPADEKLMQSFESDSTSGMSVIYNQDKTVKRLTLGDGTQGSLIYDLKYENGNVSQLTAILGGESAVFHFEHQNNIITSFNQDDDDVIPVQYDAATRTYTYTDDQDDCLIVLTQKGDIEKFQSPDSSFFTLFTEDETKFGPMRNTNNVAPYLVMALPGFSFYASFLTKQPVDVISASNATAYFTNEYFADGFLKKASFSVGGQSATSFVYKYTSLQAGN